MNDDAILLRAYVANRSEAAFAELVRRYIGLVRSTALRRVGGDVHLADDVTQTVFITLARKAGTLLDRPSLAGWLYLGTQLAAAEVVRREQRRKAREATAHTMDLTNAPDQSAADLAQLRPLLDDALVSLRDEEREAIVLRFFQKQTFAEIGGALRVNEEAARKRVDRALEKLHVLLVRRGITSSMAALGVTLAAAGSSATPEGLVARVTTAALSHAATAAAAVTATGLAATLIPVAAAVAVAMGTVAVLTQRYANGTAATEVALLERENEAIPVLRADNERMVSAIAEVESRPLPVAIAPAPRAPRVRPVVSTAAATARQITVTPEGTIQWEGRPITLDDYLARLGALQQATPDGESKLVIHANNTLFTQMAYALDEARKAGIRHIVVESNAVPGAGAENTWF
ncbi:MAG TPA: sigma-70 family RNA polymerase sigma factor [Lacunisphaera sp.]|nr:sigma-70 family RNA polymerase sigma factor [Lacunisphaera sp.]